MNRYKRRRFLVKASAVAGTLSLAKRVVLAKPTPRAPRGLKLWYTSPASQWVDALPIGNGRLGAMVFGGGATDPTDPKNPTADRVPGPFPTDPAKETLQLNEDTLWSGMPVDGNNPGAPTYLPAIRQAVLEEKDYHLADHLCQKMQGLYAGAYQVMGSLHVDCTHRGAVTGFFASINLNSVEESARTRTR